MLSEDMMKKVLTQSVRQMDNELTTFKPNPRFRNYTNIFKDLVKQNNIVTMYPIVSMIITYDSTKAVTVTKKNDQTYYVKQYDLETY